MIIIVKDGELTEKKKLEAYQYKNWFKLINKIGKLIQQLEEIDAYLTYGDIQNIRKDKVREIEEILEETEKQIQYAVKKAREQKPFWETGEIANVFNKYDYEEQKHLQKLTPEGRRKEKQAQIKRNHIRNKATGKK